MFRLKSKTTLRFLRIKSNSGSGRAYNQNNSFNLDLFSDTKTLRIHCEYTRTQYVVGAKDVKIKRVILIIVYSRQSLAWIEVGYLPKLGGFANFQKYLAGSHDLHAIFWSLILKIKYHFSELQFVTCLVNRLKTRLIVL